MIFENSEKAIAIKSFRYLWETENKEWLANRKRNWVVLVKDEFYDCPASELKRYKNYYLTGKREEYIHPATLFLLTPFGSPEEAKNFTMSPACDDPERLLSSFVVIYANSAINANILRPQVKCFSDGVLGKEYKPIEVGVGVNRKNISPEPSFWSAQYMGLSVKYFKDRDKEYSPVVDVLDYFVSALKYADNPSHRRQKDMDILLHIINSDIAASDPRPLAQEFLANLKLKEKEIVENWNLHEKADE